MVIKKSEYLPLFTAGYLDRLKQFEGFSSKAYKPEGEKPSPYFTIGYGHYGITDCSLEITELEATELLLSDLRKAEVGLRGCLPPAILCQLTINQYTALVDFVFNLGVRAFQNSTLFKLIVNQGIHDYRIPNEFLRWVYSGKKRLPGLEVRRRYERLLWLNSRKEYAV